MPRVGRPIIDTFGYKWLFLIPALVTAGAAIATKLVIPESPVRHKGRISIPGALLLTGWLVRCCADQRG